MGLLSSLNPFRRHSESAADRAAWLDSTLFRVSSGLQAQHMMTLRQASRSFAAAETPAWVENWPTTAAPINDDLARQLPTLRSRARAMSRNDEWAIGYMLRLDDGVLGADGITLQMRVKSGDALDKATNALLEESFYDWGTDCEVSGMSWREVESLALAAGPEDGELLYRFCKGVGRYGIQIQMLDPALLDVSLNRTYGGNRIRMGIEIDDSNKPEAYWLLAQKVGDSLPDIVTVGRHVRLPADQVRHCFMRRHVGQLRGYPWLSGGARRLWMLHDFEEAAAVASSNAAKRQGFFKSSSEGEAPSGFADTIVSSVLEAAKAQGKVLTPEEIQTIVAAAEKYNTTMPGQFDTLPQGYDFTPFESKWPDVSATDYIKGQLRGWSSARGMSYHTLGNDMEAVNFSSGRIGIGAERDHFRRLQSLLISWLHAQVISEVMPYLVLKNTRLSARQIDEYRKAATWVPRRWPGIDPKKESDSNDTDLRNRLTSRRRILIERGLDPDEVFAEIAEEEKVFGPPSPAPAQPAATEPDDDENNTGSPKK